MKNVSGRDGEDRKTSTHCPISESENSVQARMVRRELGESPDSRFPRSFFRRTAAAQNLGTLEA